THRTRSAGALHVQGGAGRRVRLRPAGGGHRRAAVRRPRARAMMRLPAFTYVAPRTIEDAVRALVDAGRDGMLVAGGTDLYPNMKRRQFEAKTLVGLRAIKGLAAGA